MIILILILIMMILLPLGLSTGVKNKIGYDLVGAVGQFLFGRQILSIRFVTETYYCRNNSIP